jgi:hypothetical protein
MWKNNLGFLNDVPLACINLIILEVRISEKEIGGITVVPPLI